MMTNKEFRWWAELSLSQEIRRMGRFLGLNAAVGDPLGNQEALLQQDLARKSEEGESWISSRVVPMD